MKKTPKGVAEEIVTLSGVGMSWSGESQPTTDGSYWISYKGPGGTELTVRINLEGKIIGVTVEGKQSERYGEWTKVKDAALNCGSLGLPDDVKSSFKGGECSAGLRKDYDWGYVLAGNMNSILIRIVWE